MTRAAAAIAVWLAAGLVSPTAGGASVSIVLGLVGIRLLAARLHRLRTR